MAGESEGGERDEAGAGPITSQVCAELVAVAKPSPDVRLVSADTMVPFVLQDGHLAGRRLHEGGVTGGRPREDQGEVCQREARRSVRAGERKEARQCSLLGCVRRDINRDGKKAGEIRLFQQVAEGALLE